MQRSAAYSGALSLAIVLLSACASSGITRTGKVVRLEPAFASAPDAKAVAAQQSEEALVEAHAKLHLQDSIRSEEEAVPAEKDDAAVYYFSLGQAYSLDGDAQRAIEAYRATLTYDPDSPVVRARLAAELVKEGNLVEAKEHCEQAIRVKPGYVDAYLLLAGIQVAGKEYVKALATYRKALGHEPQNRDALLYYGVTLAEVGRPQDGIEQLQKLVKLKDNAESQVDQSVAYYYLAKLQKQAGKGGEAIQSLHSALKKRPNFGKAALFLADLYLEKRERSRAVQVLTEAFRESPQPELAERLANMHLEAEQFRAAVVYLETLVEEDPTNENLRLKLALIYWQIKWHDKAFAVLSKMQERYPESDDVTYYLAELQLERSGVEAALPYFAKIRPEFSKYDQVVVRTSLLYREAGDLAGGEKYVTEALGKRPDIATLYPVLAAFCEDQRELKRAVAALEAGLERFPQEEGILYYLGFLRDKLGQRELGLRHMEKLLQVNPNNANALNFVGYTLLEEGKDLARAEDYLARAYRIKPKDAYIMDSYAWLLHKRGKSKEAMKHLEQAHALKNEEWVIAEHLADVYLTLGLRQKALAVYEKSLRMSVAAEEKQRIEQKIENVRQAIAQAETAPAVELSRRRAPASTTVKE